MIEDVGTRPARCPTCGSYERDDLTAEDGDPWHQPDVGSRDPSVEEGSEQEPSAAGESQNDVGLASAPSSASPPSTRDPQPEIFGTTTDAARCTNVIHIFTSEGPCKCGEYDRRIGFSGSTRDPEEPASRLIECGWCGKPNARAMQYRGEAELLTEERDTAVAERDRLTGELARAYEQRDDNWRRLCAANTDRDRYEEALKEIAKRPAGDEAEAIGVSLFAQRALHPTPRHPPRRNRE